MMKNALLALGLALGLVGCGGSAEEGFGEEALDPGEAQLDLTKTFNPCAGRTFDDVVPDLVAKVGAGSTCRSAVFYVANCSYVTAPASHTRFAYGNTRYHLSTPSLAPGAYVSWTKPMAMSGEFGWSVTADEYNVILESSETNNVATGHCVL